MGRLASTLKAFLFPARCLACGAIYRPKVDVTIGNAGTFAPQRVDEPAPGFEKLMDPFLCGNCMVGFAPVQSPLCPVCGRMFRSRVGENHRCADCIRQPRQYRMARAAGIYTGSIRTVIHRLKYGEKIQLAGPLGQLLLTTFFRHWEKDEIDMVVPIPLHCRRFRERGFNQSYLLVRGWPDLLAKAAGGVAAIRISKRALVRHRRTRPQTGLGRKGRIDNIRHAFSLTGAVNLTDQRVLLVDDVLTTGATVEECVRVLLGGGAAHVDVLTLARADY